MTKRDKLAKRSELPSRLDDVFEDFRKEMEGMMRQWAGMLRFPRIEPDIRMPLVDMADRGDRYELQVEVPGIEKDKIDVKATIDSVEISGEHAEKVEEKKKGYVYSERSQRSFYRKIPVPDEVDPSKVTARLNNGILTVELPKKEPTKQGKHATKVQVQ